LNISRQGDFYFLPFVFVFLVIYQNSQEIRKKE